LNTHRAKVDRFAGPSKLVDALSDRICSGTGPILDAGCGFGRNGLLLRARGASVVFADNDGSRLSKLAKHLETLDKDASHAPTRIVQTDLNRGWPFRSGLFTAVIAIHFIPLGAIAEMTRCMAPGGTLVIESYGGHGENWRTLPPAEFTPTILSRLFYIESYVEHQVGPATIDAVSFSVCAVKQ